MYEKDPYHVNDLIDGSGVNVGVGTRYIRCRSSNYYELGWDADERFNVNQENCG